MESKDIKLALYNKCLEYVEEQIKHIQEAINAAKESGNDETKSSAGDKHETGRAHMQLEQEKNSKQLNEVLMLRQGLAKIDPKVNSDKIVPGSLVITNQGNFYISISAGKINIIGKDYFSVSPASPIALNFAGKKAGDNIVFNGKEYRIEEVL